MTLKTVWLVILTAILVGLLVAPAPSAHADDDSPYYCYSTGKWLPWPVDSGYCPDGRAPYGQGPDYGSGNHRWPDGSDD